MKKRIQLIHIHKKNHTLRVRSRYTLLFFVVSFSFFLVISCILYGLSQNGVAFDRLLPTHELVLLIGILCIILGYGVSYLLMDMIYKPMEMMSEASQKVARGDYQVHLEYNGRIREINTTIENFNFMVQELNSVEIMRNDFITNVSHEFRTPLSSITGYVTLLQDSDLTEAERNEYIQLAFFNIEKLNDLTGNILQLSKLENQRTLEEPVSYRLDEQIREAIVILEPKWNYKNIQLDLALPKTMYTGQQSLLFQVWTNLIGNAIKFSYFGGNISISLEKSSSYNQITISDQGTGMSDETLNCLFEKFYQGDSSRRSQGNGLGLALCKKIIDLCHGTITVTSKLNEGSTFTVCIPDQLIE